MREPISILSILLVLGLCLSCGSSSDREPSLPATVDFNFHIKPILSDRCFKCHGPDEKKREADLRLDTEEGAFAALGEQGDRFAVVAGNASKSELVHRINSLDPDEQMPPPESNLSLSAYEIKLLEKWIEQGAAWKAHWAFISPTKHPLPDIRQKKWPKNEIDYYVLAKLEKEGVSPAEVESKEKWLRRVSFDLTGLPPTLQEIDHFLADNSEAAYSTVVDRLLAAQAFGERMASPWLDAARYADSHGYQDDRPRTIWPWRDWVIDAFNQNMPYDSFLIWQIAGDLLPDATYKQKLATAFNRNHGITQEGGVVNEEYITEYVADRTNTLSTAVMGLTMECARCHDHKYDPISQKDYYQLFAFFNRIDESGQISYFDEAPVPNMRMEDVELEAQIAWIDSTITHNEAKLKQVERDARPDFDQWATTDLPNLSPQELVKQGLMSHHTFDKYTALTSPNELASAHLAKANTGLIGAIAEPVIVEGANDKALAFDGENFMDLGDIGDFEWYDHFSFGGWIRQEKKLEKAAAMFSKRNGEQRRGGYELLLLPDRRLQASLIHDHSSERISIKSQKKVKKGTWAHVFVTYDGSGKAEGLTIYINGKAQKSIVIHDQLNRQSILNGNDFIVGHWTPRNLKNKELQGFEGGEIDEVKIYNRDLSPWELGIMAGNLPTKQDSETAYPLYLTTYHPRFRQYRDALDSLRAAYREVPYIMIMQEADSARATYILARGAYDAKGEEVAPNMPEAIMPFSADLPKNRLGLAKWLTDPKHPLTARVFVNRCWQLMFGRGLVKTAGDFGSQGELPSHPALLDYLAVDFVAHQWNIKWLMRQIALSATYGQSARISPKQLKKDPENTLLARGPNQRFSSEMMRDNALSVSGLLNRQVGGPWVKPYQPQGVWRALANQIGENKYRASKGKNLYRRSLYTYWKRTIPPPMMLTFDAAERSVCVVKRQSTSTPLQALVLLNDPQYVEASRVLAQRMLREGGENNEDRLRWGFRLLTSRWPLQAEMEELTQLLESLQLAYQQDKEALNESLLQVGDEHLPKDLDRESLTVFTVLANTLLNLDEAKMKS